MKAVTHFMTEKKNDFEFLKKSKNAFMPPHSYNDQSKKDFLELYAEKNPSV